MTTSPSPAVPEPDTHIELPARARGVDVLVLDVDGVLTDGSIVVDDRGVEIKRFHVRDGWAINAWRRAGKRVAILSGRTSKATTRRAAELGITPVVQGAADKTLPFLRLLDELRVGPERVAYMGDDLPDLPPLRAAGLAACPADAVAEVRAVCHLVARSSGGHGAVRELIERIMKEQGLWEPLLGRLDVPATATAGADEDD